jgi:phosphate transport system substrate-binding protein
MSNSKSCSSRGVLRTLIASLPLLCGAGVLGAQQRGTSDPHLICVWGYVGLGAQLARWESEYTKLHPEIHFRNELHGAAAVMAGLYNGVGDLSLMGREIWPVETMAYRWVYQQPPFGVVVATTGLDAAGELFTPVVIVNAKNPLRSISLSQLDAIYGSEHRAAAANIRTWGDLGLEGAWANKPIHPYGFGGEDALGVFFRQAVLRMDFKPNPASHLLSDRDGPPTAATRIAQAVAMDPYAIGYTRAPQKTSTRILMLDGIRPDEATLSTHEYGLTRSVWVYFRRFPDKPIEPKVDSFIRFLLGADAQALVGPVDQLIPLTPELDQEQLHKLEKPMSAPAAAEDN